MNDATSEAEGRDLVREAYAISSAEYDRPRLLNKRGRVLSKHDIRIFSELYREAVPSPDCRVLEVAAGTGRFTLEALTHGGRIVATDVNESLLDGLRTRTAGVAADHLEITTENAFSISYPTESFDVVYAIHFIPRLRTLSDQTAAIMEMGRVLRPGGHLIINLRNSRSWLYGRLHRDHAMEVGDLQTMLKTAGLEERTWRVKHLITRRLLDLLPQGFGPLVAGLDWHLRSRWVHRAWDIFVLARKDEPG